MSQREKRRLPAIRSVLAAYRSTETHITQEQITAAWAEYDALLADDLGPRVARSFFARGVATADPADVIRAALALASRTDQR